jgi:methyl-accepting chemotaxis protein
MREQAASLNRTIGGFVIGADHTRPAAQVHLIAAKKEKPAGGGVGTGAPGRARAQGKPAPQRAAPARPSSASAGSAKRSNAAAAPDVDWEEF